MSSVGYRGPGRLYRDAENGIFLGVCAGVARFFDFRVAVVRIVAVISLLLFFWPTAAIYLAAGWLLKPMPLAYRGRGSEAHFWRRECRHGQREHCR